jgi:hypothetical protein
VTYTDSRSTTTKITDTFAELFDDLANAAIDEKVLTADESAEIIMQQLDEWLLYYGSRYTFYCSLKDALKQRICKA